MRDGDDATVQRAQRLRKGAADTVQEAIQTLQLARTRLARAASANRIQQGRT
ncbi:MAG TPA: hypothetical protein VF456_30050 [Vicinamibacterales bacterium]